MKTKRISYSYLGIGERRGDERDAIPCGTRVNIPTLMLEGVIMRRSVGEHVLTYSVKMDSGAEAHVPANCIEPVEIKTNG